MQNITAQQFSSALNKAPKKVQDIGFSPETSQKMGNILSRHNVDDNYDIAAVTGYILVGLIPIKRFIQALQEDAGLDEGTAKNVAHDIRAEILAPVAKELAAIQEKADVEWTKTHSDGSEAPNPESETNSNDPNIKSKVKEGSVKPPTSKDESVAREVFPAPEVKDDKFDKGPEGEMPEDKKDSRF